jgi:hAT family C-terminal dimerisation region
LLNELRDNECFEDQQINNNELLSYCLKSMEDDQIDILEYWKRNATAYPTLAMMSRDVFAVSVSTITFESCFSSANMVLTNKRTKLGSKLFEQLVCSKDWIDAESRMQHDTTFEAATSAIETQEPISLQKMILTAHATLKIMTYGICIMTSRSLVFLTISIFLSIFKYFNYFLNFFLKNITNKKSYNSVYVLFT